MLNTKYIIAKGGKDQPERVQSESREEFVSQWLELYEDTYSTAAETEALP